MDLVIVESPTKAESIQKYLGNKYLVLASKGHICDLAKGGKWGLGVDVNNNFKPHYVLMPNRISVLEEIIEAAKKSDNIYLCSDPDREGFGIAYNLLQRLEGIDKPIKRATFREIKKDVILKAIKNAGDIDMNFVHAYEARRILDRLVGFMASPFLMNFYGSSENNLSSGRVQSVITKLITDREDEIKKFTPENFWTIQVNLSSKKGEVFNTKYSKRIVDSDTAKDINKKLQSSEYIISKVLAEEENVYPSAPLITSTLQQFMSRVHSFNAERTMKAAQSLYELGLCSYIRTDSTRISEESLIQLRDWLSNNKYNLPKKPFIYKNKDSAQDAHECLRPVDINLLPWDNYSVGTRDEKLVYEVIWRHFVASQMTPAIYNTLKIVAHPKNDHTVEVKTSGKAIKYEGFLKLLGVTDESKINIPNLTEGEIVFLKDIKVEKKQTQPPPRYSEHKLIKELDGRGIGRPATYADLLSKITARNYVEKKGNVYHATDLGIKITQILNKYFTYMDYNFTAFMESQLDLIEHGKLDYIQMLKSFYPKFKEELNKAYLDHGGVLCDKCGSPMSFRLSKINKEKFLACGAYPHCTYTKSI